MIFRIYEDTGRKYKGHRYSPIHTLPLFVTLILGILFPSVISRFFGDTLLVPLAMTVIGCLLLYEPKVKDRDQNIFLLYLKKGMAMPFLYYAALTVPYTLLTTGDGLKGTFVLPALILGFFITLLCVSSGGFSAGPLPILWIAGFLLSSRAQWMEKATKVFHILCLVVLAADILYGIILMIKEKDTNRFYLLPKAIAFFMGCVPVLLFGFMEKLGTIPYIIITVLVYGILLFVYGFVLKQEQAFNDVILHPFFLAMAGACYLEGWSSKLFPSVFADTVFKVFHKVKTFINPTLKMGEAFGDIYSKFMYWAAKMVVKFIPKLGYAVHPKVTPVIGTVFGVVIMALLFNIISRIVVGLFINRK